jgi:hypothetical protein
MFSPAIKNLRWWTATDQYRRDHDTGIYNRPQLHPAACSALS